MVKCFQSKFWQFLYFIFFHSVAKYLSQGIWLVISEVTRNWFRISEKELSYRNIIYSSALSVHIKTFYHLTSEFEGLYCSLRCTKLLDQSQMHNPEGLEIVIFCNQNSRNFLWIRCGFFLYSKVEIKIKDHFCYWVPDPLIDRYYLVKSINQRVWSPKTKAKQTFISIVIWQ